MHYETISENRSGNIFLLGKSSELCIAMEVTLTEPVDGEALEEAVQRTAASFPLIASAMVPMEGRFYYAKNDRPIVVEERQDYPLIGGEASKGHLLAVRYWDHTIGVAFQHALTDGVGIMRFLETMLYFYFCTVDGREYPPEGIRTDDGSLHERDWDDPFIRPYEVERDVPPMAVVPENGLTLPEAHTSLTKFCLCLDASAVMRFVKEQQTSPAIAFTLLMMRGLRRLFSQEARPITAKLPVDLRARVGLDEAMRNCVTMTPLTYVYDEMDGRTFAEQAAILRTALKVQTTEAALKQAANGYIGFMNALSAKSTIKQRRALLSGELGQDATAFLLNYVSGFRMSGYEERIKGFTTYEAEPCAKFNIYATKNHFFCDLLQPFETARYMEAFVGELAEHGLTGEITSSPYTLPRAELAAIIGEE